MNLIQHLRIILNCGQSFHYNSLGPASLNRYSIVHTYVHTYILYTQYSTYVCTYMCTNHMYANVQTHKHDHTHTYTHTHVPEFQFQWTRGQNNTYEKKSGGGQRECAIARLLWGLGACSPIIILNFIPSEIALVHFQTHLWFSNDMMK